MQDTTLNSSAPSMTHSFIKRVDFAHAARHSKRVSFLRKLLPVLAIAIAGSFAFYSYAITPEKYSIDMQSVGLVDGKLVMADPKINGFTKEHRPYRMNAVRAIQDLTNMDLITLEGINATLPLNETTKAVVNAPTGIFDNNKQTLNLTQPFKIVTNDGMDAKLKSANIEIETGNLKSYEPVEITVNGSQINADSLFVTENGDVLVFENRVKMNVIPNSQTIKR